VNWGGIGFCLIAALYWLGAALLQWRARPLRHAAYWLLALMGKHDGRRW